MKGATEPEALAAELEAFVDALIPGNGGFPSASAVGTHGLLATRLREIEGEDGIAYLIDALAVDGGPLAGRSRQDREAAVASLEESEPAFFLRVRNIVYLSYYEQPAVHARIRRMGFTYHAVPLPEGYDVGRFEPADTPRHGRGSWIPTEEVRRVDLSRLDFLGEDNG